MKAAPAGREGMRKLLLAAFQSALDAASPAVYMPRLVPKPVRGQTLVIAAGKAAIPMAQAFADCFSGPFTGMGVTVDIANAPRDIGFGWLQAAHPVPNAISASAGLNAASRARELGADDQLVLLLSGGASAMLCAPPPGITLDEKRKVVEQLLHCGAPIGEFNTVRRELSLIKGGRLAALAHPARTHTVADSDVPGDVPADIASGPTVASPTDAADAREVIKRWSIRLPARIARYLDKPLPHPSKALLAKSRFALGASPRVALAGACGSLRQGGWRTVNLGSCLAGEAREAAAVIVGIAQGMQAERALGGAPAALVCGGELTVAGSGSARGGPNCEFALAAALRMGSLPQAVLLSCDTDGIDGSARAAGAIADAALVAGRQARAAAQLALQQHSSAAFLDRRKALVKCGPTGVNVNDLRILLLPGPAAA